ncbi:hypothetical protein BTB_502p06810 (plasmid) [Bacillus thuringiensis Bt407]|uniref:Uncharacterized protein n=1 Tax=Bacillus thuringiensis T01-328 TaxID=1324966 RepID=A0AAN4HJD0_BACTU|nr:MULTISPECIES: hypothetical protein [Bacillus cereus group]AFV21986.1 hypothetical protein BTB_502p06810 [Bacillus thuringiensis Bt407]EEM24993.1 hypothetical protein bthur0002_56350 [Bacillus thuringiensis Bt407]ERI00836.1 hypothetical protein BTCBT_002391 [Bacillus thuringiensis T01-328]MDF9599467.1 hypothetical protein [Bacillus cereus]
MEVIYTQWHNNYDNLVLNEKYTATLYKKGWLLIETGLYQKALYREECFTVVK